MPQIHTPQPPEHVLNAFPVSQGSGRTPEKLGVVWDFGWKIGDAVYARSTELSTWSAKVREKLVIDGARVVRPLRSTDGRFAVSGWKANQFVPGDLARRVDETAALALRWDAALKEFDGTLPALERTDVFARAEHIAWEETGEGITELPADVATVYGHADLLMSTIYSGTQAPVVVEAVPTAVPRPEGYTAALVIVDGLIAGAVDDGICDRFAHVVGMDQLLLRAVAYRRQVNNLHPESQSYARSHIERVESLLVSRAHATM